MTFKFTAEIYKTGINPCVDVPPEISAAFGKRGYIPVTGTLNGQPFIATLVPIGKGRHRLFINGSMRKAAGVDVGDMVTLAIIGDDTPRAPKRYTGVFEPAQKRGELKTKY